MIRVKVKVIGALLKPDGKDEFIHECKKNITIRELLSKLKYNERHIEYIMSSVNEELKSRDYVLKNNDSLVLLTIIGGG